MKLEIIKAATILGLWLYSGISGIPENSNPKHSNLMWFISAAVTVACFVF